MKKIKITSEEVILLKDNMRVVKEIQADTGESVFFITPDNESILSKCVSYHYNDKFQFHFSSFVIEK